MSKTSLEDRSDSNSSWFGHPQQLARLFTTEMWERFGYYGMRALLTLYLAQHFLFNDNVTNGLYGAFTSLVYLTPLFGGLLADQYLGYKRSVKFGAILMAIGYLTLCFGGEMAKPFMQYEGKRYDVQIKQVEKEVVVEGKATVNIVSLKLVTIDGVQYEIDSHDDGSLHLIGDANERTLAKGSFIFDGERKQLWVNLMFLALSCVIVGNGFFKPNISTMVGSLYSKSDSRRDAGFTIFYMGINMGSMISQFLCPLFQVWFGFWAGFLLAAVGMLCAWALFQFDGDRLKGYGEPPAQGKGKTLLIFLGAICAIPVIWLLLNNTMLTADAASAAIKEGNGVFNYLLSLPILGKFLFCVFLASVIGIPIWSFFAGTREEGEKMVVATVLVVFSVVFWTLFEQAGSSMTLFAERNTERHVFGNYEMPAAQTQIFNPLFIVIFAPLFSIMWLALGKRGFEPSIPVKFAIGLILVGLGFMALVYGSKFASSGFQVGLFWLALAYLLHSLGELCISPVGLSMITKLSMVRVVGLMMGVWFLSSSMAQYVGGIVAQLASVETVGGEVTNPEKALQTYVTVFNTIGIASMIFGVVLLVLSPFLKRMMHGVR